MEYNLFPNKSFTVEEIGHICQFLTSDCCMCYRINVSTCLATVLIFQIYIDYKFSINFDYNTKQVLRHRNVFVRSISCPSLCFRGTALQMQNDCRRDDVYSQVRPVRRTDQAHQQAYRGKKIRLRCL